MTKRLQAAGTARRNLLIAAGTLALHVALVWALQNGLQLRPAQMLVPVELLSEWPTMPVPPPDPPAAKQAPALTAASTSSKTATPPSLPTPASPRGPAAEASLSASTAPVPLPEPVAASLAAETFPATASVAATPKAIDPPPSAAALLQLPSSSADYLHNPKPRYPPLSARLGETGRTVYRVWVGADGKPQRAELVSSSGFARLDHAALETVMGWRYVPGQRGGVPELMDFNVPIRWEFRN